MVKKCTKQALMGVLLALIGAQAVCSQGPTWRQRLYAPRSTLFGPSEAERRQQLSRISATHQTIEQEAALKAKQQREKRQGRLETAWEQDLRLNLELEELKRRQMIKLEDVKRFNDEVAQGGYFARFFSKKDREVNRDNEKRIWHTIVRINQIKAQPGELSNKEANVRKLERDLEKGL